MEPRESQDLSLLGDEIDAHARARKRRPTTNLADRYHLCFALGKALEDRGEYARVLRATTSAATRSREPRSAIGPSTIERNARLQAAICTRGFLCRAARLRLPEPDPIFIVGLPRSGSTLLEQILASHSRVEGTMELPSMPRIVQRSARPRAQRRRLRATRGCSRELDAREHCARLGEKYLADTRRLPHAARPFFIDKMPNNFRHIGLIHLILPNAKIIDARREPMACCFSNFKQLFASGQEFTYGIEDIARYYRMYLELMDHWDAALPGRILRVQHEDVVDDLEGNVRRLLDFCGLDFEPACLEFHKTERSVRTASSEQVRRPIYSEGLDQWRPSSRGSAAEGGARALGGGRMKITALTPAIGAVVDGLMLADPLDEDRRIQLEAALARHHVLFFRDQRLTPAQHRDFAAHFGALHVHPIYPPHEEAREIMVLDTDVIDLADNALWHTDVTFLKQPPMGAVLAARILPPQGGDTLWSSCIAAFEALSAPYRSFLGGLTATHDIAHTFPAERFATTAAPKSVWPPPGAAIRRSRIRWCARIPCPGCRGCSSMTASPPASTNCPPRRAARCSISCTRIRSGPSSWCAGAGATGTWPSGTTAAPSITPPMTTGRRDA